MVPLTHLWLPILGSAAAVFLVSSLVHMVLKWHQSDYRGLAQEEGVRAALQASAPTPGQYVVPHCTDLKDLERPEVRQRYLEGPVALVVVSPNGLPAMGTALAKWAGFAVAVAFVVAYVAGRTLAPGAPGLQVLRVTGTITCLAYGFGGVPQAIWMGRPWSIVAKDLADALLYGLASGAVFAWLWP